MVTGDVEPRAFSGESFRIGDWLVEPSLNRISRGDTSIQLELRVMDVLVCLAQRAGKVVTRQEIVDRVWATEFIADNTLTHAINEIRTALGDDARNPSFIETIHRRGYRLMVPVTLEERPAGTVAQFPSRAQEVRDKDLSPYPGLAAFTEADAEFFFGREDEVAQMWRKLTSRRLLAVIGPSGVGKSSFLRAGVIPAMPDGWGVLVCQPGEAPFAALARALVPEFAGDEDAISKLVHLQETGETVAMVSRWRGRHDHALIVVDQFEELFTLNLPETQGRFAELLRRLVDEADAHVLLSMRDDFLHRCHDHDALEPVFDSLTPVKAPAGRALHWALVKPAKRQGFAFEDYDLPGEMVIEVEGERGALPLLAFAVARLWDKRDRDGKLLTRQAYEDIGGVGGALARHAEDTLKAAGNHGLPIVREIFRNLVTAQGTRAVRSVDDLMSVFQEDRRDDATEVLGRLIDARLLTSFEEEGVEGAASRHRVEVVHESLLSSWPRLVGWQTQDADSARLRDELRQAAKAWEEHHRPDDWLWTGAQYREFASWRERYPGGLSAVEEDFGTAMTAHAKRRKRRRRIRVAMVISVLLAGLGVVGSLWRQSVREARRAEAVSLFSLGQLELDSYPSATIAHVIASLELADSAAARQLALQALWKGPTAFVVNREPAQFVEFTPDGGSIVQSVQTGSATNYIRVTDVDGTSGRLEGVHESGLVGISTGMEGDVFLSWIGAWDQTSPTHAALWSASERTLLADHQYVGPSRVLGLATSVEQRRVVLLILEGERVSVDALGFDGDYVRLGTLELRFPSEDSVDRSAKAELDRRSGRWLAVSSGREVSIVEIGPTGLSPPRHVGRLRSNVQLLAADPGGRFVASGDRNGRIQLWDLTGRSPVKDIDLRPGIDDLGFTPDGSHLWAGQVSNGQLEEWDWSLADGKPRLLRHNNWGLTGWAHRRWDFEGRQHAKIGPDLKTRLWQMGAPADADPTIMQRGETGQGKRLSFHPQGNWLTTSDIEGLTLWPLARPYPAVIRRHQGPIMDLAVDPEGRWLVSSALDGTMRLWPLEGAVPAPGRALAAMPVSHYLGLAISPGGKRILVGTSSYGPQVLSLTGEPPLTLGGFRSQSWGVAISPDGRLAAAAGGRFDQDENLIRVWDVVSGDEVMVLDPEEHLSSLDLHFTAEGRLLAAGETGLQRFDLETGEGEVVFDGTVHRLSTAADGRRVLLLQVSPLASVDTRPAVFLDFETGESQILGTHGTRITQAIALDSEGTIAVTGDQDGVVRVGPVTGEEPHLLLGHQGEVWAVAVDPLGRWVASAAGSEIRIWPMPDLSKPPLHTLPREELIAKLKTLTNLRVVRDEESSTGWKLTHDPFPGWETVPTW